MKRKRIEKANILTDYDAWKMICRTIYQDKQGYYIYWHYRQKAVVKIREQWMLA